MSMRGKRELREDAAEQKERVEYPVVSHGDAESDRADTERRLQERRQQREAQSVTAVEEPQPVQEGERRMERTKKILIVVCAVLAVVLLIALGYRALFVKPELDQPALKTDEDGGEQVEELDVGDGLQPMLTGERKSEDFYTFLILGRDTGGGGNCDTMLLASYDMTNQKVTIMSIPRDTMVNVPWDVKKINSVYNRYGAGEKGIEKLKVEISQLVGFKPDYTVVVEWEAVGELVDAIGGVWFDVPRNMRYWDPYQDLEIVVDKGYQKLDGETAMGVVRWRKNSDGTGYADGDLGRIGTQQEFLKAVISQVLQVKNAVKLFEFAKIFEENVTTELTVQNLFWLAKGAVLGGLSMENIEFVTMPNKSVSCWSRLVGNMQSYVVPRAGELLELVNTKLSPFTKVFTLADLDIMSVNSDGSVSSTTGRVEDAQAAVAPVIPSDAPTEDEEIIDPEAPDGTPDETPAEGDGTSNGEGTETPVDGEGDAGAGGEGDASTPAEEEQTPSNVSDEETYDPASGGEGFIDDGTGW